MHTFCNESMRSAIDLSARYLTLFHWKERRYWSTGSAIPLSAFRPYIHEIAQHTVIDILLIRNLALIALK